MKSVWLLGLMSLLLTVVYQNKGGAPLAAAQSPDRSVTMPQPAAEDGGGKLPARISEYLFLHQTRHEALPVLAMAGVNACPE